MITELSAAVFVDFGESMTLRRADGSGIITLVGLWDEAGTDYTTEHARVRSNNPQITAPALSSSNFSEGDFIEARGVTWEVLDVLADGQARVFTIGPAA